MVSFDGIVKAACQSGGGELPLDHIVLRSSLNGFDPERPILAGGQYDYRCTFVSLAQTAERLKTLGIRQLQIHQHRIEIALAKQGNARGESGYMGNLSELGKFSQLGEQQTDVTRTTRDEKQTESRAGRGL